LAAVGSRRLRILEPSAPFRCPWRQPPIIALHAPSSAPSNNDHPPGARWDDAV
jgi:hypothetical protein